MMWLFLKCKTSWAEKRHGIAKWRQISNK